MIENKKIEEKLIEVKPVNNGIKVKSEDLPKKMKESFVEPSFQDFQDAVAAGDFV